MTDLPEVGTTLRLEIGAVGNGGVCVARHEGTVVLVRHALPGEQVLAEITETRSRFCRADAVQVLRASPDRVSAPCPHAGPGRCGGCDWQHASASAQRELKAEVVREQFRRVATMELGERFTGVEALPGGLLGWRTRISYAVGEDGQLGLRRHRSHEVEPLDQCPLGASGVGDAAELAARWPGHTAVQVARGDDGTSAVLATRAGRTAQVRGPRRLHHDVGGQRFRVSATGFWQVHPGAAAALARAALDALQPRPGERALDLYAGAGALTAALAEAVGASGRVLGLESGARAVRDAVANLAGHPWAEVRRARVQPRTLAALPQPVDLVVLDPPRAGAGAQVMRALLALQPRAVCYISCDPATLARDVAVAGQSGWALTRLRAIDAFPMTHHVECVAELRPERAATS